jgi:hypothetical protein
MPRPCLGCHRADLAVLGVCTNHGVSSLTTRGTSTARRRREDNRDMSSMHVRRPIVVAIARSPTTRPRARWP